jgi:hypothetical protein
MQTKFSIEVIVDYRDKTKLPAIVTAVKRAAARLNAAVQLLADGQHPSTTAYSDDFFTGKTELEYLFEEITEQEQVSSASTRVEVAMSDEFLKALKGE